MNSTRVDCGMKTSIEGATASEVPTRGTISEVPVEGAVSEPPIEGTTVSEEINVGGMLKYISGRWLHGGFGGGCDCRGHLWMVESRDSRGSGAGYV